MIYAITAIVIALVLFWLLKPSSSVQQTGKNITYVPKGDPNAQGNYEKIKFPPTNSLSTKELLELSWKFLYDLTEAILNKFSIRDQQEIIKHGRSMAQNGMKYMHVVDSNPKVVESYTKKTIERGKPEAEQGRK